jgi:pimeloyl-ACP methyl ester carboxylesterase
MRAFRWIPILLLLSLTLEPARAAEPAAAGGHWEGEINLPQNQVLQLKVDLEEASGAWKGTVDIPSQGAKGLPLEQIAVQGSKVRFVIAGVPGAPTFDGALENGEIRGAFTQGGGSATFRLGRQAIELVRRPQEPKPPFPYTAEEVTYKNGGVTLAGTLTIPPGDGPFPAVVLITGSGPQDRDETVMGHKPFLILSDYLSRHGVAVLRADDRGVGGSTGSTSGSTTADFAQDALAGVRFLKTHAKIDPAKIGLLGHSEGGVIAPLAASQSPDVAFIILLAGTGAPAPELLLRQAELISRAEGMTEEAIRQEAEALKRTFEILRSEQDPAVRAAKLREAAKAAMAATSEQEVKSAGGSDAWADQQAKRVDTPWFVFFMGYDPRPALGKVKVPVLALNGELDLQVPVDMNLPAIERILKESGNRDVTAKRMPGLNHLFQHAKTGSPSEYTKIEETMSPEVLSLIGGWITERFAAPGKAPGKSAAR